MIESPRASALQLAEQPAEKLQRATAEKLLLAACCLLREPSLPRSVTSLLSSVHEAVKREKGAAI